MAGVCAVRNKNRRLKLKMNAFTERLLGPLLRPLALLVGLASLPVTAAPAEKPLLVIGDISSGLQMEDFTVSPDGKWMAFGESRTGSPAALNIQTGELKDLP